MKRAGAIFLVSAVLSAGCSLQLPGGVFGCETDGDCPTGWACGGDQRCYPSAQQPDAGHAVMDGGGTDGGSPTCDPACPSGQHCDTGRCVANPVTDEDMDGIPAATDCDDTDPNVGTVAQRDCPGGTQRCTMGTWGQCIMDACNMAGATESRPCGNCGQQLYECGDDLVWHPSGSCDSQGECSAGSTETGDACGNCGAQSRNCPLHLRVGRVDLQRGGGVRAGRRRRRVHILRRVRPAAEPDTFLRRHLRVGGLGSLGHLHDGHRV